MKAAGVEVAGPDIGGVVDDIEFRVEDLGLVFADADAVPEEFLIKAAGGGAGEAHVRAAGKDEFDGAAFADDPLEGAAEADAGEEVGDHDADVAGAGEVSDEGPGDGALVSTRAAEEDTAVGTAVKVGRLGSAAQHVEPARSVLECVAKHPVEGGGEFDGDGAAEKHSDIAPAPSDAVSHVLGGDIETADEGGDAVDDCEFPVIPDGAEAVGAEPDKLTAGGGEGVPERVGEGDGSDVVDEDPDADAASGGQDEGIADGGSGIIDGEDVDLEVDGTAGGMNQGNEGGEVRVAVREPFGAGVCGRGRWVHAEGEGA